MMFEEQIDLSYQFFFCQRAVFLFFLMSSVYKSVRGIWFSNGLTCRAQHYLDNNNYAPSFLRSLCEIGGDCFGPRYFSEGGQLPKKNTVVQDNHRRIHTMTKKRWCKVIIVIDNRYFDNFVCCMCIFLTKTRRKQHFLSFLYSSL